MVLASTQAFATEQIECLLIRALLALLGPEIHIVGQLALNTLGAIEKRSGLRTGGQTAVERRHFAHEIIDDDHVAVEFLSALVDTLVDVGVKFVVLRTDFAQLAVEVEVAGQGA